MIGHPELHRGRDPQRFMNPAKIVVRYGRDGVPWYEARRDPTRLAPDPATTPEAVIQVYAARAVSWRGVFSMHTWIAVKPSGAPRYARYEVLGFGVAKGSVW